MTQERIYWVDQYGFRTYRKPVSILEHQYYDRTAVLPKKEKEKRVSVSSADGSIDMSLFTKSKVFKNAPVLPTLTVLTLHAFPLCCGAEILCSFPYDYGHNYQEDTIKSDIDVAIQRTAMNRRGQIVAITNHIQTRAAKMLEDKGFVKVSVINNPNHSEQSVMTTWIYSLANNSKTMGDNSLIK